jgi:hypothetical protein
MICFTLGLVLTNINVINNIKTAVGMGIFDSEDTATKK